MKYLFEYNWMVRDEWFDLLQEIPKEELTKNRVGGLGNILETMFHIVKVEHNWICDLSERPISSVSYSDLDQDLDKIKELSKNFREDVQIFVEGWENTQEQRILHLIGDNGNEIRCTYGEALRHIIAHEIHHMGQLSVWVREIGLIPVSSNLIHKGVMLK